MGLATCPCLRLPTDSAEEPDLLARHSLGEKGFAEYKASLVKRERLIDLVTDLEKRAKKISQKVMQIQTYIVD